MSNNGRTLLISIQSDGRWAKRLTQPWELRFQPILDSIKERTDILWKTVHASHILLTTSLQQWAKENGRRLDEILAVGHEIMGRQDSLLFQMARLRSEQSYNYQELFKSVQEQRSLTLSHHILDRNPAELYDKPNARGENSTLLSDIFDVDVIMGQGSPNPIARVFPDAMNLETFETKRIQQYVGFASLDSFGLANIERNREIHDWVKCHESRLIWVDGWWEKGVFDWTTMFSMEIAAAAITDNETVFDKQPDLYRSDHELATCLLFFCSADSELLVRHGPSLLIEVWIAKLIQIRKSDFDAETCRKSDLYVERFKQATTSIESLVSIFKDCVAAVRSLCFYLIVDNIDVLYNLCVHQSSVPSEHATTCDLQTDFQLLLACLKEMSQSTSDQVKVLVTSRVPLISATLFDSEQPKTDGTRHKLLKVLRQEHKNVRSAPVGRRKYRVSIQNPNKLTDIEQQQLLEDLKHDSLSDSDKESSQAASSQNGLGGNESNSSDEELQKIRIFGMLNRQNSCSINGSVAARTDSENSLSDDDVARLVRRNKNDREMQQQAHLSRMFSDPVDDRISINGNAERDKESHSSSLKGGKTGDEDDDDLIAKLRAEDPAQTGHLQPCGITVKTPDLQQ